MSADMLRRSVPLSVVSAARVAMRARHPRQSLPET